MDAITAKLWFRSVNLLCSTEQPTNLGGWIGFQLLKNARFGMLALYCCRVIPPGAVAATEYYAVLKLDWSAMHGAPWSGCRQRGADGIRARKIVRPVTEPNI